MIAGIGHGHGPALGDIGADQAIDHDRMRPGRVARIGDLDEMPGAGRQGVAVAELDAVHRPRRCERQRAAAQAAVVEVRIGRVVGRQEGAVIEWMLDGAVGEAQHELLLAGV